MVWHGLTDMKKSSSGWQCMLRHNLHVIVTQTVCTSEPPYNHGCWLSNFSIELYNSCVAFFFYISSPFIIIVSWLSFQLFISPPSPCSFFPHNCTLMSILGTMWGSVFCLSHRHNIFLANIVSKAEL